MKLQIAFDFIDLDQGLRIAVETSPPADWLEVGTSLIKSAGIVAVRRFKEGFPKKEIVADMKTWKSKTGSAVVTAFPQDWPMAFYAASPVKTSWNLPLPTVPCCNRPEAIPARPPCRK